MPESAISKRTLCDALKKLMETQPLPEITVGASCKSVAALSDRLNAEPSRREAEVESK